MYAIENYQSNPMNISWIPAVASSDAPRSLTGNYVRKKIGDLLAACTALDPSVKKAIIALTRKLIATKHLFPLDAYDTCHEPRTFNLDAPVRKFKVSYAGVAHLLNEISPSLAENDDVIYGIQKLVNNSIPGKHATMDRQDAIVMQIQPETTPRKWPVDAMLYVLRAGTWDHINLTGANLKNANLRGAHWPRTNFHNARLQGSDLSHSDFSRSNLSYSNLTGCDLSHTTLRRANMRYAIADRADLRHADLTSLRAKGAFFLKAAFENAIVHETDFEGAHLEYSTGLTLGQDAIFTDAELFHARIGFNASPNRFSGTPGDFVARQLRTISTIHPRHQSLHNEMLWRLIEASGADRGELPDLTDLTQSLLSQEPYWTDQRLRSFIDNRILPPLLTRWNLDPRRDNEPTLAQVLNYLTETKPAFDWPIYCGATSQLLTSAEQSQLLAQRDALCSLLKSHPGIAPVAAALDELGLEPPEECSVFIAAGLDQAIAYPNTRLAAMLEGADSPYNGYYFVRDTSGNFVNDVLRNLDTIEACAVPLGLYHVDPPPLAAVKLLSHIFEGAELKDRFIHALTCKTFAPKRVNAAYIKKMLAGDMALMRHLAKFFRDDGRSDRINVRYRHHFWEIFNSIEGTLPETTDNVARILLCLGTLFVRFSSASLFGSESESYNSIRMFAWACIHSADMLDDALLDGTVNAIGDTLKGVNNQFQCTDTLTGTLLKLINGKVETDPALAIFFKAIYPQAGR